MRLSPLACLSLLLLSIITANAQSQSNPTTLEPGNTIERNIGRTETHTYTITLTEEQYLQFVVNQHGIDLIVRVFSPSGRSLGEFDTPNGAEGPENVSIVGTAAGSYRIAVSALEPNSSVEPGKYEIKTLEIRQATEQELSVANSEEGRRAKGFALLADIIDSLPEIRLPQTRVRVKAQSAALLRRFDEKKSARLLTEALTEAKDYFATVRPDDDAYEETVQWMQRTRYEAVQTLAFQDPEAALRLFRSTRHPSVEGSRGEQETERQFELSLANQVAAKNPKRAYELAQESLKSGYSSNLVVMLRTLRQSDQDLASSLAKDLTRKLLEERLLRNDQALETALTLIRNSSAETVARDKTLPLLPTQEYRALVQKLLNEALNTSATRDQMARGDITQRILQGLKNMMGGELDSVVPGATAAIQKKLAESNTKEDADAYKRYEEAINNSPETAKETIAKAPFELWEQLYQRLAEKNIKQGNFEQANQLISENIANPRHRRNVLNDVERQAAYIEANLGRMDEALKHVAKIEPLSERAQLLSEMVGRIGSGQKRAQALFLLETARSLLGTAIQAENQPHMNALMNLVGAFSRYDAKRGFEILDPLIDQFNDLGEAARTLNGFGAQYFVNGELSLQNGNSLANMVTPLANTLGVLSLADFDRAKTTSDRIHLPELRITVHLALAQQAILPTGVYSPTAVYWNSLNR